MKLNDDSGMTDGATLVVEIVARVDDDDHAHRIFCEVCENSLGLTYRVRRATLDERKAIGREDNERDCLVDDSDYGPLGCEVGS